MNQPFLKVLHLKKHKDMKRNLLGFLFCLLGSTLFGQAVIQSGDIFYPLTPDTAKGIEVATAGLMAPTIGANQTWNYSAISGNKAKDFSLKTPNTNPNFPNATGMLNTQIYLGPILISGTKEYFLNSGSGFYYQGLQTINANYNIAALTGGTGDILTTIASNNNFGKTVARYQLPLTSTTQWTNNYHTDMDFAITVGSVGLVNAPGQLKRYYTESYEVVGWGSVVLPSNLGTHNGLLLKTNVTLVDSLFLNGLPANPILLAGLGLTQGFVTEFAFYDIFIRGLNRSAIQFEMDPTFTNVYTLNYCSTPAVNVGIDEVVQIATVAYPNPSNNGYFTWAFYKPNAKEWQVEIIDVLGRTHLQEVVKSSGDVALNLRLPNVPGTYLCVLKNELGEIVAKEKVVF